MNNINLKILNLWHLIHYVLRLSTDLVNQNPSFLRNATRGCEGSKILMASKANIYICTYWLTQLLENEVDWWNYFELAITELRSLSQEKIPKD